MLPLLQETLGQLWDRRQGQTLTLADYQALGDGDRSGLAVALARRANAVLRPLTAAQEVVAAVITLVQPETVLRWHLGIARNLNARPELTPATRVSSWCPGFPSGKDVRASSQEAWR